MINPWDQISDSYQLASIISASPKDKKIRQDLLQAVLRTASFYEIHKVQSTRIIANFEFPVTYFKKSRISVCFNNENCKLTKFRVKPQRKNCERTTICFSNFSLIQTSALPPSCAATCARWPTSWRSWDLWSPASCWPRVLGPRRSHSCAPVRPSSLLCRPGRPREWGRFSWRDLRDSACYINLDN